MRVRALIAVLLTTCLASCSSVVDCGPDPARLIEEAVPELTREGACFMLRSLDSDESAILVGEGFDEATSPCSIFKIPHALIALEEGVFASSSNSHLAWDGKKKPIASWERDHDLGSAIRHSVVWYFQEIARRLGPEREEAWLDRLDYGNADPSSGLTSFWLSNGSLKISPREQLDFWERLVRRKLPFSSHRMNEVMKCAEVDRRCDDRLLGKTGSGLDASREKLVLGWFVGAVETDEGRWVFACRLQGEGLSGAAARATSLRCLEALAIWPPQES